MADKRGVRGVGAASVEKSLKAAGRTAKIVDRFNVRGEVLRHLFQSSGCVSHSPFTPLHVCWNIYGDRPH